jgi:hypothetical protein
MDEDQIPPAESARDKRRDRDAEAQARAGMRTGLAKQFKQVLDSQRKRADEVQRRRTDVESDEGGPAHRRQP